MERCVVPVAPICTKLIALQDWANMQSKENQETGIYRITGTGDFVLANRIAYEFGLQGPS
jgi:acyl transferase domain-containing protein